MMIIEQIAKVAHDANKSYCHSIGDHSQPDWLLAPDWQRESAVKGVKFHLEQLRKGVKPSPSASHEAWLEEKRLSGWKCGPVKDPEKKEHPCFVSYDQLPVEQRIKDYLFAAIVEAFFQSGVEIT
jgi:hypothetical protein